MHACDRPVGAHAYCERQCVQRIAPDVAGVVIGPQLFRIDVVAVLIDVIHRLLELLEPVRWLLPCRDMPMIVKTLNPAVGQAWVYTGYVVLGVLGVFRGLLRYSGACYAEGDAREALQCCAR